MDFTKKTVDEIRAMLIELGMSEEDVKEIKGKQNLIDTFNSIDGDEAGEVEELDMLGDLYEEEEEDTADIEQVEPDPTYIDPGWTDFLMSHLMPEEKIKKKGFDGKESEYPTTAGLRRMVEMHIGPIVHNAVKVVDTPRKDNHFRAVVECEIGVAIPELGVCMYSDVADVFKGNTKDPFYKHPTATAATKAEGRALRKALRIRTVMAAEEVEEMGEMEEVSFDEDKMDQMQKVCLEQLCKRHNINLECFVNCGECHYTSLSDISKDKASEMIGHLHTIKDNVPEILLGYKDDWRDSISE